jgi:hypothetical protein
MRTKMMAVLIGALVAGGLSPSAVLAQKECPPEVAQAEAALKSAQAALKSKPAAKGPQDIQAPRAQAGARTQDVNAPRTQDVNAPRTQDVNAPRVQDTQAPSGGKVREQDIDAPRVKKAERLVSQAQSACKKDDMTGASAKAKQALAVLK